MTAMRKTEIHASVTESRILNVLEETQYTLDNPGICLSCGEYYESACEPDARNYLCEGCGNKKLFGVEQILIEGLYHKG